MFYVFSITSYIAKATHMTTETTVEKKNSKLPLQLLFAVISGLALAACFPGFGSVGSMVWVWMAPLFIALWSDHKKPLRRGMLIGLCSGLTFWAITVRWVYNIGDLTTIPWAGGAIGWVALSFYLSSYFIIYGAIVSKWLNPWKLTPNAPNLEPTDSDKRVGRLNDLAVKPSRNFGIKLSLKTIYFAILHASLWVLLEWMRSWVISGFTWNGLGTAFHDNPVIAQSAELFGVIGLSFLPVFISSTLLQVIARLITETRLGKFRPHWDIGIAALILILHFQFGVRRLHYFNKAEYQTVNVLLVQRNVPNDIEWGSEESNIIISYLEGTEQGLDKAQKNEDARIKKLIEDGVTEFTVESPDLVIWPESALPTPIGWYEKDKKHVHFNFTTSAINNCLEMGNFELILGLNEFTVKPAEHNPTVFIQDSENAKTYNSLFHAKRSTDNLPEVSSYRKDHLVMFGEYIPLRNISLVDRIYSKISGTPEGSSGGNFEKGGVHKPLDMDVRGKKFQVIPSVCFEDTVPLHKRKFIRDQPQMIVNITNDGWFPNSHEPEQHMITAAFRCIEFRRPMVRAANTGVTCIIDARGSLFDHKSGEKNKLIDTEGNYYIQGDLYGKVYIPTVTVSTLYARWGNWFIYPCLITLISLPFVRKRL